MGIQGKMVIEIWSSDDDAGGERTSETGKKGPLEKENKTEKKGPLEKENRTGRKGQLEKENRTGKKGTLEKENRSGKKELLEKDKKTEKKGVKDMGDSECVVLDCDPFDTVDLSKKLSTHDTDQDLSVLAERGQVACRDYPHSRHLCVKFPFSGTVHETYCEQCYCYVCDSKAPCKYWKGSEPEHCHASDRETKWRSLRREARRKPFSAQNKELTRREIIDMYGDWAFMDDSDGDFSFPALPFMGSSSEDFMLGGPFGYTSGDYDFDFSYTSDDSYEDEEDDDYEYNSEDHPGAFEYNGARPNVQDSGAVRKIGTVKSFSDETGHGFITPDYFLFGEGRDLSFRASSVMLDGSSSRISRGDMVEYEIAPNGVAEAVKIIRPATPRYGNLRGEARISHQKTSGASHGRGRLTGTLKWFCSEKGYGFIIPDDGSWDVFVHHTSIQSKSSYRGSLSTGQRVEFEMGLGRKGREQAVHVSVLSQANGDGEGRRDRGEQAVTSGAADRHSHLSSRSGNDSARRGQGRDYYSSGSSGSSGSSSSREGRDYYGSGSRSSPRNCSHYLYHSGNSDRTGRRLE